jgi:hypothetical protein
MHPRYPTYVASTSRTRGAAAALSDRSKWRAHAGHINLDHTVVLASVEAHGHLGKLNISFFSACPRSVCAAVCSVLACYVLLVGASVAAVAVPAGEHVFAAGVVHSCLRPLSLPPSSRVARRRPPLLPLLRGVEAEVLLG